MRRTSLLVVSTVVALGRRAARVTTRLRHERRRRAPDAPAGGTRTSGCPVTGDAPAPATGGPADSARRRRRRRDAGPAADAASGCTSGTRTCLDRLLVKCKSGQWELDQGCRIGCSVDSRARRTASSSCRRTDCPLRHPDGAQPARAHGAAGRRRGHRQHRRGPRLGGRLPRSCPRAPARSWRSTSSAPSPSRGRRDPGGGRAGPGDLRGGGRGHRRGRPCGRERGCVDRHPGEAAGAWYANAGWTAGAGGSVTDLLVNGTAGEVSPAGGAGGVVATPDGGVAPAARLWQRFPGAASRGSPGGVIVPPDGVAPPPSWGGGAIQIVACGTFTLARAAWSAPAASAAPAAADDWRGAGRLRWRFGGGVLIQSTQITVQGTLAATAAAAAAAPPRHRPASAASRDSRHRRRSWRSPVGVCPGGNGGALAVGAKNGAPLAADECLGCASGGAARWDASASTWPQYARPADHGVVSPASTTGSSACTRRSTVSAFR